MRHLEHCKRQHAVEEGEALIDRRCRSGEQQQGAGEEGEGTGDLRHHRGDVHAGQLLRPGETRALRRQLLGTEQEGAEHQRHEVIDRAVGEQRTQQRLRRHVRHGEQDHGFEDTDSARDVADDAGDHRRGINTQEGDKGHLGIGRQKRPQHRARERQVEHRQPELRQRDRRPRRVQRPAAHLEHPAGEAGPQRIGEHGA